MTNNKCSVATHLSCYYRQKGEKMPLGLKILLFNYNIETMPYVDFVKDIRLCSGPDKENGNIDGDEEKEVVKFILDPSNSYFLGKIGHEESEFDLHPYRMDHIVSPSGIVIDEGNIRLLLK